jgi:hypothetical protein
VTRAEATAAVIAAAREMLASSAPKHWPTLRAALTALDTLPVEAPLKPGDWTIICREGVNGGASDLFFRVVPDGVDILQRYSATAVAADGTVSYTDEMRVDPDAGLSLTHAQAAELCATLARARVP